MSERNYKVGDKVRFIDANRHRNVPTFYPPVGTVGTIVSIDRCDDIPYLVRWSEGTTSKDDTWWLGEEGLEPVEVDDESD